MPSHRRTAAIARIAGLSVAVILAGLALLAWTPVHRSPIQIADPVDPDIPADWDALVLRGEQDHDTYVISLPVRGIVQDSAYIVGVLVRDDGRPEPYVYRLQYQLGTGEAFGGTVLREGNTLTFHFPLSVLWGETHIVGLDATVFGPDSQDYVVEGPRPGLRIQRLLAFPIDPSLLGLAAAAVAIASLTPSIRARLGPPQTKW